MDIVKRIDAIRSKPEHIRERYVWAAVGICMLLVLSIWFFSFKMIFKQESEPETPLPIQDIIDKSKESFGELPSIESIPQSVTAPAK